MKIAKNQSGFKRLMATLLIAAVLFCNFPPQLRNTAAADSENNMYIPRIEDTMLNSCGVVWPDYLEVSDLKDGGIKLNWKETNPEVVEGIAKAFPLDGLTMRLDNLAIQDSEWCNLAFVMTDTCDWSVQMKNNQSVTLILNTIEGKLQAELRNGFDANWTATVEAQGDIIVSEILKYDNVKGKPFEISLHKESGSYRVDVDIDGTVLQGWIDDGYFKNVADPENVLVALSPTQNWQKMSVDLKAIGPCFVWPENERRVISQEDNMVLPANWPSRLEWEQPSDGAGLKLKWKDGAQDMRVGIAAPLNLNGLAIEINDYNKPIFKGSGVPAFVIGSAQLPDTWDTWAVDEHTANLTITFDGNNLLAKAKNQVYTIATNDRLHPARLVGKPVRLVFRAVENGDYNVEIKVGSWSAAGTLPKNIIDAANGITDTTKIYVSATVTTPNAAGAANASYVLNGIYNDASEWDLAAVVNAVNAIDTVQLADGSAIREARRLYNIGSEEEKEEVPEDIYNKLTAAETEYARLTAEADEWLIPMNKANALLSNSQPNAVNNMWKNWIKLTDLADGAGLRYQFTGAGNDIREGFGRSVNLDGLTLQMDNLYGNGCFALFFGEVGGWGPDILSSKLTLVFHTSDGTITDKNGNVIIKDEALEYANLKQKRFAISFDMNDDRSFSLKITVNGKTVIGTLNEDMIALENTTRVFVSLTAYGENETFDIDFLGVGTIDKVQEVIDLIDAIGLVKIDSENAIEAAQNAYDKLSQARRDQVVNYKALEEARAYWYSLDFDEMISDAIDAIDAIGTVNELSGKAIQNAQKTFDRLADAQKAKVTNAAVLTNAVAKYNALIKPLLSFEEIMYDPASGGELWLEERAKAWWNGAIRIERPETGGAKFIWTGAVRNMRDGPADSYNLDGLCFQICDITKEEGKDGAQLSIQIGTGDNEYAGWQGDCLALVLDTINGELRAYPGGGLIIKNDALKHSAIEGKALLFEIRLTEENLYQLTVKIDDTILKGIISSSALAYAEAGLLWATDEVMVALTPWGEDGNVTASFSATLLSIQSVGSYAFEQWMDLVFAIDALPDNATKDNADEIVEIYEKYCALSRDVKAYVTNYNKLSDLMQQVYEMGLVDYSYLEGWLNEDGTSQVKTGDTQPVSLFVALLLLSSAVLLLTVKRKKHIS